MQILPAPTPTQFQSAPRSFDQGDSPPRDCYDTPAPVSIRAPVFRPGRQNGSGFESYTTKVSIRAPVFRPGRRSYVKLYIKMHGFNPRPGLSTRATRPLTSYSPTKAMFQSAPRSFDQGDWEPNAQDSRQDRFQSAPRSFDQGDEWTIDRTARLVSFQSAPRSFDQGDLRFFPPGSPRICFNPRPGLSTRATKWFAGLPPKTNCFNPRPGLSTRATKIHDYPG